MNVSDKRNLAEQVEKNKQDILRHFQRDEVLADFGIRIIGQLESASELPESAEEYGDAYAVGTKSPFNYYIWTRANNLSPVDYWFNFGEIAIAGPQGPKGDKGDKGDTGQSTYWISILTLDYLDLEEQNIPLDTMVLEYGTGNVYQVLLVNGVKTFDYQMNIKGPQGPAGKKGKDGAQGIPGPQGPKGDTGDVGGFINIAGVLISENDLPDPSLINNLTVAYLVGTMEPYSLYVQVGSTSRNAEWLDAGPLNVATMVTVNGQYQNTWNADTKLDKHTEATPSNQVYVKSYDGTQAMVDISPVPAIWQIPSYDGNGRLKTNQPTEDNDCVNKGYADTKVDKIPLSQVSGSLVYVRDHLGSNNYRTLSALPAGGAIPVYNRSSDGQAILKTEGPEEDNDCANKGYVDDAQFWSSLEQQFNTLDDEYYINLEANYQYQISATMEIKYRKDGSSHMEYLNFNTGSLYVPSTDEVHKYRSVSSFIKLEAYTNEPALNGMYLIIGEYYQDSLAEVIDGVDYYQTRVYVPEPAGYADVDIEEVQVITTWKKVY